MNEVVQFELEDGTVVYMEGAEERRTGAIKAGGAEEERQVRRFATALACVRPAADAVMRSLREINTPAEIGLEFGLTFSTDVNAFVVSGNATATFKVSLTWKNASDQNIEAGLAKRGVPQ